MPMPQINELRIGNYVYDDEGYVVQIKQLSCDEIEKQVLVSDEEGMYFSNIYSIPITADWLLEHWFYNWEGNEKIWSRFNFICELMKDRALRVYDYNVTLYYVHQLQNLYFVLNKTEL